MDLTSSSIQNRSALVLSPGAGKPEGTELLLVCRHSRRNRVRAASEVTLKVPKLPSLPFETAIIERYRRRESSVQEALVEM